MNEDIVESLSVEVEQGSHLRLGRQTQHQLGQYIYYICRTVEIWAQLLEFKGFSKDYDQAMLAYARLTKLLQNSKSTCFPLLDDVLPATEATCCMLHRLAMKNRQLTAALLTEVERHVFGRDELMAQHNVLREFDPERSALLMRYWEISESFFATVKGLLGVSSAAGEELTSSHIFQGELQDLQKLGILLNWELQQFPLK